MSTGAAHHSAVLYDSADDLRARVVPYLQEGIDRGDAVVVAVAAGSERVVRSALGADGGRVQWGHHGADYEHLGAMFAHYQRFFAGRRAAGAPVRMLTENCRTGPERRAAYLRFEAMANDVLGVHGQEWACLFGRRHYSQEDLRQVEQAHPFLLDTSGRPRASTAYLPAREFLARHPETPGPVPDVVEVDLAVAAAEELADLRRHLAGWAGPRGTDVHDVLTAVGEVVTNALEHGGRPCRVRAWTGPDAAHVRVDDPGAGEVPVDAGYHPPSTPTARGGGLWLARRLADVVRVASGPGGTAVGLRFPAHP